MVPPQPLLPLLPLLVIVMRAAAAAPTALRTGAGAPPDATTLAIDAAKPLMLSWQNTAPQQRGAVQTAYELEVRELAGKLVWSSGMVVSVEQQVTPQATLGPDSDYSWRVKATVGASATWSAPLNFSTAPSAASWEQASWIGGKQQLRSDLTIPAGRTPVRARLHASGVGAFVVSLNGDKVGDHVLDPPQSVYPYGILYSTFDVLDLLVPGHNALGAMLGNYKWGYLDVWCDMSSAGGPDGCRAFVLQLSITLDNGTELLHMTTGDEQWQCRQGPVLWDHLHHGETYDARNEVPGSNSKPYKELALPDGAPYPWQPCVVMSPPGSAGANGSKPSLGPLTPALYPPIRITETFSAVSMHVGVPAAPADAPANCWSEGQLAAVADECRPADGARTLCSDDCVILEVLQPASNLPGYYAGPSTSQIPTTIKDLEACKAACLAREDCVELTFAPTHHTKQDPECVLYTEIAPGLRGMPPQATGWVKCAANSTDATQCASFSSGDPRKQCSNANPGGQIHLKCAEGQTIKSIDAAVFGWVEGSCYSGSGYNATVEPFGPRKGEALCSSPSTHTVVERLCIGKPECRINASMAVVAGNVDPCASTAKRLAVTASGCTPVDPYSPSPPGPPIPTPLTRWIFDFSQNIAGYVSLKLPAGHDVPDGWRIRLEHAEILHAGPRADTFNTYCHTDGAVGHPLRHEPCAPHPGQGHETPDRYIGDWNSANQTDEYVIKAGGGAVNYTPSFTAHGFRYCALSVHPPSTPVRAPNGTQAEVPPTGKAETYGFEWRPTMATLSAHFLHTDVAEVGHMHLTDVPAQGNGSFGTADILNKIHSATRYSQLSNLFSLPTDCPQREKRGWLADAHVSSEQASLQWDMQSTYSKFLADIAHSQNYGCTQNPQGCATYHQHNEDTHDLDGCLSDVVPYDSIGQMPGTLVWQAAYVILVRNHWRHYGDAAIVKEHYPGLVRLMTHFQRTFVNVTTGLADLEGHGDWVCVGPNGPGQMGTPGSCARTPASLVTAFYHIQCLSFMSDLSAVAGQPLSEVSQWSARRSAAVKAFHRHYFDERAQAYAPVQYTHLPDQAWSSVAEPHGSQTSNAMALALGAPPDEATRAATFKALVDNVDANGGHLTVGMLGMQVLLPALAVGGRGDLALSILLQDTYPSLGHMIQQNQTTLCEDWTCGAHRTDGPDAAGDPSVSNHRSLNHIMYGAYSDWMIHKLGGLETTSNATSTGWRHIIVAPDIHAVARLRAGGFSLRTRFGLAAVSWAFDPATKWLTTNVTVPVGSTAEVVHMRDMPAVAATGAPASELQEVYECEGDSGRQLLWSRSKGVEAAAQEGQQVTTLASSGSWTFISQYK